MKDIKISKTDVDNSKNDSKILLKKAKDRLKRTTKFCSQYLLQLYSK